MTQVVKYTCFASEKPWVQTPVQKKKHTIITFSFNKEKKLIKPEGNIDMPTYLVTALSTGSEQAVQYVVKQLKD
jgi:hypothetical protein